MRKINYLLALMLSMATLGIFAQKTEKPKKDLKNQKRTIVIPSKEIKPDKKVEYPGVEWKPKQELNTYPGVEWLPKKDSLSIIKIEEVGDDTQEGLQKRIAEAERRIKLIVEERRRLSKLKSHYIRVMFDSKRKLAKLQGETEEQTFTQEELRERHQRIIEAQRERMLRAELEKAKDYDQLERIVAEWGKYIKFKKNSEFLSSNSDEMLLRLVKAMNINGHARLIVGVKKKGAGLANARVKRLKALIARKGLVPNMFRVSKLNKNAKSKYWLSENSHIWFRVERL